MSPRRAGAALAGIAAFAAIGLAGFAGLHAQAGGEQAALSPDLELGNQASPAAPRAERKAPPLSTTDTPMAERIAVIGVLSKRDGVARDVTLKPGGSAQVGPLKIYLRACEKTADWEPEQLTGAFVQADLLGRDKAWRRIFSGWLYKESPSLNAVQNPYFDVWPKSCSMKSAESGPDTIAASSGQVRPRPKAGEAPTQ